MKLYITIPHDFRCCYCLWNLFVTIYKGKIGAAGENFAVLELQNMDFKGEIENFWVILGLPK